MTFPEWVLIHQSASSDRFGPHDGATDVSDDPIVKSSCDHRQRQRRPLEAGAGWIVQWVAVRRRNPESICRGIVWLGGKKNPPGDSPDGSHAIIPARSQTACSKNLLVIPIRAGLRSSNRGRWAVRDQFRQQLPPVRQASVKTQQALPLAQQLLVVPAQQHLFWQHSAPATQQGEPGKQHPSGWHWAAPGTQQLCDWQH